MGVLLHLNPGSSPSARKAVRTHSTLRHVSTLRAESIQHAAWQHSGAPVFVSKESRDSGRAERRPGASLSLLSVNSGFSSPPHPVRTCHISKHRKAARSVRVHVTGVCPLLLRLAIQPQEVFVAWGATHPGLPEPHCPGEEELALPRPHPAL